MNKLISLLTNKPKQKTEILCIFVNGLNDTKNSKIALAFSKILKEKRYSKI